MIPDFEMTARDIKPRMEFEFTGRPGQLLRIVREGKYVVQDGKRIPIDNRRKNKWYVINASNPNSIPELWCFDAVLNDREFRFLNNDTATD